MRIFFRRTKQITLSDPEDYPAEDMQLEEVNEPYQMERHLKITKRNITKSIKQMDKNGVDLTPFKVVIHPDNYIKEEMQFKLPVKVTDKMSKGTYLILNWDIVGDLYEEDKKAFKNTDNHSNSYHGRKRSKSSE